MNSLKFKKSVGIISVFTKITFWVSLFALIVAILGLIIIPFIPKESNLFLTDHLSSFVFSFDNTISYNFSAIEGLSMKSFIISMFVSVSVSLIISTFLLLQLTKVLVNVKNDSIFTSENAIKITYIGYAIILYGAVNKFLQLLVFNYAMDYIQNSNIDVVASIDLQMVFVGILVVLLGKIFEYGSFLQKEYDQTI